MYDTFQRRTFKEAKGKYQGVDKKRKRKEILLILKKEESDKKIGELIVVDCE